MFESFIPSQIVVAYALLSLFLKDVVSFWYRMKGTCFNDAICDRLENLYGLQQFEFLEKERQFLYVIYGPDIG